MGPSLRSLITFLLTHTNFVHGSGISSVLSRAVPSNFWMLQREGITSLTQEVSLCTACCESADIAALQENLAALTACGSVAVEMEASQASSAGAFAWSDEEAAQELVSDAPRSFLLPGATYVQVNELNYADGGTVRAPFRSSPP